MGTLESVRLYSPIQVYMTTPEISQQCDATPARRIPPPWTGETPVPPLRGSDTIRRAEIILMKHVLNTLLFTILVPATVAGWVPWSLRGHAQPSSNLLLISLSALLIAIGVAIYLHTAFLGIRSSRSWHTGTHRPHAETCGRGLAPLRTQSRVSWGAAHRDGTSRALSSRHPALLCRRHLAGRPRVCASL